MNDTIHLQIISIVGIHNVCNGLRFSRSRQRLSDSQTWSKEEKSPNGKVQRHSEKLDETHEAYCDRVARDLWLQLQLWYYPSANEKTSEKN